MHRESRSFPALDAIQHLRYNIVNGSRKATLTNMPMVKNHDEELVFRPLRVGRSLAGGL